MATRTNKNPSRQPRHSLLAIIFISLLTPPLFAQESKPTTYTDGQQIEVREGDTWSKATIQKKEGRKYQIKYDSGEDEWVTADRIRTPGDKKGSSTTDVTSATTKTSTTKPAAPQTPVWDMGTKVEVKWGGSWRAASIINKRADWYLVAYSPGSTKEWVEWWRIRKVGSTEDNIPIATPNGFYRTGDNPPREKAGPAPAKEKFGSFAEKDKETVETAKADPLYKAVNWGGAAELNLLSKAPGTVYSPDTVNVLPVTYGAVTLQSNSEIGISHRRLVIARQTPLAVTAIQNTRGTTETLSLQKVNLTTGQVGGAVQITGNMSLLDINPNGKSVLLRSANFGFGGKGQLEIWSIEGAEPAKTTVLIPFVEQERTERDVAGGFFINPTQILVQSGRGKMGVVDITDGKVVWTCSSMMASCPALSATGKYLAFEKGKTVLIVEPLTGKLVSELPQVDGFRGTYAFSPNGQQLVGFNGNTLRAWNLAEGTMTRDFTIGVVSAPSASVVIPAEGYAVVGNMYLLDIERRLLVWKYEGIEGAAQGAGRTWVIAQDSRHDAAGLFPQISLKGALAAVKGINPEDFYLLKPRAQVSLSVEVTGTEEQKKAITQALKDQIKANGFVLTDGAAIRITACTRAGKSKEVSYRMMFGGQQTATMTEQLSILTIEAEGKKVYERQRSTDAGFSITVKEGQTVQQAVDEASKPDLMFLQGQKLPAYLPKAREPAWLGSSSPIEK